MASFCYFNERHESCLPLKVSDSGEAFLRFSLPLFWISCPAFKKDIYVERFSSCSWAFDSDFNVFLAQISALVSEEFWHINS
jgi:hypothetical protein